MKKFFSIFAIFSFLLISSTDLYGYTIRITCRSKGCEKELCENAINEWLEKNSASEHKVEIVTLPHASNECFALYQQWLSAGSFDIDILQMDVAWVGVFSDYLEPLDAFYTEGEIEISDCFEAIKNTMYSNGKLVALPWYTDCGIMYYRRDLLEKYNKKIPKTWEELYETAYYIQNEERKQANVRDKFYGFIFQAKAFEILTCNFIEFLDSFGGRIIDKNNIVVNSDRCVDAVQFMVKSMRAINSKGALNYSEEDARGVFQSGNAVFMRSWPYAWALMNEKSTSVANKIGVISIPPSATGGKSTGVLGGWFLVVSKYSKNKKLAADLAKFLTSKIQQKKRAKHSYLPAFKSLYSDPEVLNDNPFFASLYEPLESAVTRPSIEFGKNYSRASSEIYNCINTILTESIEEEKTSRGDIKKSLNRLAKKLSNIIQKQHAPKKTGNNIFSRFWNWLRSFFIANEKSNAINPNNDEVSDKNGTIVVEELESSSAKMSTGGILSVDMKKDADFSI